MLSNVLNNISKWETGCFSLLSFMGNQLSVLHKEHFVVSKKKIQKQLTKME